MKEPLALTIGCFDGVHLGHTALIQAIRSTGCKSMAITFINHPASVLGRSPPPALTPWLIKKSLLQHAGLDTVIGLTFTSELAELSFEEFLKPYSIQHLFVGEGASFGKDKLGTAETLTALGKRRGFEVHIVPKAKYKDTLISSTHIRKLISSGLLIEAENLLGRPHCLHWPFNAKTQALPPDGEYPVWIYTTRGCRPDVLSIRAQVPHICTNEPCIASFSLNPLLAEILCHQTSPAAL